ncbi:DUF6197 family protein [Streptomyces sp. 1222.5]|uniref:DUF6197 family protein n=1 Tax=Streptomyces sp. 1222.5 TaxID=1881026 RepID=UPI003D734D77
MASTPASDLLAASCPGAARARAGLPFDASNRETERTLLTHALHCPTCRPAADQHRQAQAEEIARLAEEAQREATLAAVPVLEAAAKIIEANGFHRRYLWDTRQAATTPLEFCRVDIAGALAIVLHGSPTYAGTPQVRAIEQMLVDRVDAPSLAAWYAQPGIDQPAAVRLLRDTAHHLTTWS